MQRFMKSIELLSPYLLVALPLYLIWCPSNHCYALMTTSIAQGCTWTSWREEGEAVGICSILSPLFLTDHNYMYSNLPRAVCAAFIDVI